MKVAWLPATAGLKVIRRHTYNASRQFATSTGLRAVIAAPETSLEQRRGNENGTGMEKKDDKIYFARLIPNSPSYFTAQPLFVDDLLHLQTLLTRYEGLPLAKPGSLPRVAWTSPMEYKNSVGETIKASKYKKMINILQRLYLIHPALKPREVQDAINEYKRGINPFQNTTTVYSVDNTGKALGVGRRKSSSARAWLVEGTGEVLVNGKTLVEAFARIHDRESAIWALKATERIDKYNVWCLVSGGGTTGQAEALTMAVGKALLAHEPALKPALRKAGCITRDPRRVERKKPGHLKARKMPAWVKR